jgi:hypothetical protein
MIDRLSKKLSEIYTAEPPTLAEAVKPKRSQQFHREKLKEARDNKR